MLQLVLGRSGSGKTHTVFEELTARVSAGESGLLLIVPEQFSFESERTLLRRLGGAAGAVQVLSFTRMATAVARECGGLAGRLMDDVTRTLLMSRALAEVQDRLVLYRRQATRPDYVRVALDVLAECKQYAVTPHRMEEVATALPEGTLRQKLTELSCIMEAYGALVADSYVDPADALTRLAEQLSQSDFACNAVVYVDGFKGFTEQEMQVMALLMRRAARTVVTLCTDTLDTRDEYALFAPVARTAARFVEMARDAGVSVAKPLYLLENHRYRAEPLAVLERGCFEPEAPSFPDTAEEVTVAACADRYEECRVAVREIRRLLREQNWRCRDIAVTARNLDDYRGILDTAFTAAGIPFYMDQREDIATEPLIALAQGAIGCVTGGWRSETLLQMTKTGLLGFSAHSAALIENYIYMWGLSGRRLREEWIANPEGLSVKADTHTAGKLWYLNLLRRRLVSPLLRLFSALSGSVTGLDFATAVFRYLEEAQVPRLVRLQTARLSAAGDAIAAEHMARTWDALMGVLDRFGTALRTTSLPSAQFEKLFAIAVSALDMGSIPQGLDAVQVGSAERMRFSSPRAVWILGANEGVFPAYPAVGGLFSDRERRSLAQLGLTLSGTGDQQAVEERLVAYLALSAPSERLYMSYLCGAGEGGVLPPSALVETVTQLTPHYRRLDVAAMPESAPEAFACLSHRFHESSGEREALFACFAENPAYSARLAAMQRAADNQAIAFHDKKAAAAFFGSDLTLSPSQVERFFQCRFSYFCRYGLGILSRRPAELGGLEFGNLTHYVMQEVLPRYTVQGFAQITRAQVTEDTAEAVAAYIEEFMGGTEDKSARFTTLAARLQRTVTALLWQVVRELRQSNFVPTDYELAVGYDGVPATLLTLPDNTTVRVVGKIDRVDVYRTDGTAYVRVVDYKTGHKDFRLSEVVEGINLQMLLYIFSLWDNGAVRYGAPVLPAGVLYLPAKLPVIKVSEDMDEEKKERERTRTMRMNGLLLDNPEIIEAMEAEAAGLFIPAKLTADGSPDRFSSVASLKRFGELKLRAEKLLRQMAEDLHAGRVAPLPVNDGKELDGCRYCDYRAVCGREAGDPVRAVSKFDAKAVWESLDREFAEDEQPV